MNSTTDTPHLDALWEQVHAQEQRLQEQADRATAHLAVIHAAIAHLLDAKDRATHRQDALVKRQADLSAQIKALDDYQHELSARMAATLASITARLAGLQGDPPLRPEPLDQQQPLPPSPIGPLGGLG